MSRTILTNVDGFTPVIDDLARELGTTTALVFGRVWRYCQMDLGVCTASQTTIANDLDLSRETVNRCLKQLVTAGYLNESEKPGVTKTYQDTGRAQLIQDLRAGTCDRRSQPKTKKPEPVIVDHNPVINDHNPCDLKSQPPVIVDHTKIDSLREDLREKTRENSSPDFSDSNPDPARVLNELKSTLRIEFDQTDFSRKIKPLQSLGWLGETLRIGHPNEPVITFLNYRGRKVFERNLRILTGNDLAEVEFVLTDGRQPA